MSMSALRLNNNPDLTKAQIDELQKALPKCKIYSSAKKVAHFFPWKSLNR